jgi:hypothetical protein
MYPCKCNQLFLHLPHVNINGQKVICMIGLCVFTFTLATLYKTYDMIFE